MENDQFSTPVNYAEIPPQKVMSVTDWLITLIITGIPLVGFIMLFVWAFGGDTNLSKKNFAKASILLFVIVIALYMLFFFVLGGMAIFGSLTERN